MTKEEYPFISAAFQDVHEALIQQARWGRGACTSSLDGAAKAELVYATVQKTGKSNQVLV